MFLSCNFSMYLYLFCMYLIHLTCGIAGPTEDHKRKFNGTFVCISCKTSLDELSTE